MNNILKDCEPRQDILGGTFNPEIFTALISEVLRFYSGQRAGVHPMYTDAEQFFRDVTYPTDGLKMLLSEVFARLAGDNTAPAIHRLETAFGGGKTHALIACAHIGFKGSKLASITSDLIDEKLLPGPGEVAVIGIAGDEIPVHKPRGAKLVPYTLWGEITFQIGGEELYREVEEEASSYAAPGKTYFDTVFGERKVLLMLDELAQYAARLSAARPDGGDQLAAFLMSLHGYARSNPGIAVVLTLASATDAFANQTERLAGLLSEVMGKEVDKDEALGIGQQTISGVTSVVARDATPVVPVQAAEISRVMAKRLFARIDTLAAGKIASEYEALYRKNSSFLPDEATRTDYKNRMAANYPFHPTLIDFLNKKLATSEDFQGTRGVLRVLSLAVRNIWKKQESIPMIHACHLDLRDARTVNELLGRTGSGDLLPVLNADIGGADTDSIEGGHSNAELADLQNPHPEGWPMYEYTWKTLFLHSLAGRNQGLSSNIFGLTEQDALFNVTFPGLTPPQVAEALKEITNSAFYLRYNQGRYYASLDPSINIALAKIRRTLAIPDVEQLLDATARKAVSADDKTFHVVHDVAAPEHIPDNKGKPVLALVALGSEDINIEECVTTAGPNKPRLEQNLALILVPDTVTVQLNKQERAAHFEAGASPARETGKRLRDLARTVLAMRRLSDRPQDHGINPKKLDEEDFKARFSERENALVTAVTESYRRLWYPSSGGKFACKEIRTAGGEGGVSVLEQIRKTLLAEGELVTAEQDTQSALTNLRKLFFAKDDAVAVDRLRENFQRLRDWPILDAPSVLDQLVRAGVGRGIWCLFRMGDDENTTPDEFYSRETGGPPFNLDLNRGYSIVTPEGARKRGWAKKSVPDPDRVQGYLRDIASEIQVGTVNQIAESIARKYGEVPMQSVNEAVTHLVQDKRLMTFKGGVDQEETPDLVTGAGAALYTPDPEDVIIIPAKAAEKGWIKEPKKTFNLSGKAGAKTLIPLLRRIGSLYQRGGTTSIDTLDVTDLTLPKGGTLRIALSEAPPETVKELGELFEVVAGLVQVDETTEAYLDINNPQEDCPFMKELRKGSRE